jgi:aldehyde:ferredoxin oxidoreductase
MWEFVSAVTGWDVDKEEAYRIGERIANIRQAFNVREGFNALEHSLHPRIVGLPPFEEGPTRWITLDTDVLFQDFLKAMDWDLASARPSAKKLRELGLPDVAEDLW